MTAFPLVLPGILGDPERQFAVPFVNQQHSPLFQFQRQLKMLHVSIGQWTSGQIEKANIPSRATGNTNLVEVLI